MNPTFSLLAAGEMEYLASSIPLSNVLLGLLLAVVAVAATAAARNAKNRKAAASIPGPWRLPFIGNLHNVLGTKLPHHRFADLARKHGPLMHLQLGQIPCVVVSSPLLAAEFLKSHDMAFAERPASFTSKLLFYDGRDLAFAPYGEYWRTMKKLCVLELLSARRVASFRHIREAELSKLMESISLAAEQGSVVNLTDELFAISNRIVSRACCGTTHDEHQLSRLVETVAELIGQSAQQDLGDLFPSFGTVIRAVQGTDRRLRMAFAKMDGILDSIIRKHQAKSAPSNGDETHDRKDLLDLLLEHLQLQDLGIPLTVEDVKATLTVMLAGGTETSASIMEWAMSELMRNPSMMDKLQFEVRQVFREKGKIDETAIADMHYLKLVIKETLRLHIPIPILGRECRETCQINGHEIPAKTRVLINAWALGRDPDYWEKPHDFIPERFSDLLLDFKGSHDQYLPFGAGRRMCPGANFGFATIEHGLARLLCHFDWELVDGVTPETLNMETSYRGVTHRKVPLCLVATARLSFAST